MEPKLLVISGSRHTSIGLPISRLLLNGINYCILQLFYRLCRLFTIIYRLCSHTKSWLITPGIKRDMICSLNFPVSRVSILGMRKLNVREVTGPVSHLEIEERFKPKAVWLLSSCFYTMPPCTKKEKQKEGTRVKRF